MASSQRDFIRVFESHGVQFSGERGNQSFGNCPFSGKDDKFYVNTKNGLWDSKTAGLSGNVGRFLGLMAKEYEKKLELRHVKRLAENRQLHRSAFSNLGMGLISKGCYSLPVMDSKGTVTDIRKYYIRNNRMRSTAGCPVGLFGAQLLSNGHINSNVYICEGEWDAIALRYLLKLVDEPGVVVAVPGAGTFKDDWAKWLNGRNVYLLYDADEAGQKGEELATQRLKSHVRRLHYVHWPDAVPNGFDTRDWIIYGVTVRNTPDQCWERLKRRFHDSPKSEVESKSRTVSVVKDGRIFIKKKTEPKSKWLKKPPTLDDVHAAFNKWFFLRNTEVIDVLLSALMTQRIDGSPVWLFIVGPPGSAKTAIISSLSALEETFTISTLTPPSLISGAAMTGTDSDPSLIPKLDGKTLVVKDFTSILSLPDREQKEIFGILRDAYDGNCTKIFGNGVTRRYESRFTVLAATTPAIHIVANEQQGLGERFLKFQVGDNLVHLSEDEVIRKAIDNVDQEGLMKFELTDVVKAFVERTRANTPHPSISDTYVHKIVALAKFGARMRGTVARDRFHNDMILTRPTAEVGTRLAQQLAKLAKGMAMVYGRTKVTADEFSLLKKVMLDTISQKNEDILRTMITAMGGLNKLTPMSLREISLKTAYPFSNIQRAAQDLAALHIITRKGSGVTSTWQISDYILRQIMDSGLYETKEELTRPAVGKLTFKLRRVKPHPRKVRVTTTPTVSV